MSMGNAARGRIGGPTKKRGGREMTWKGGGNERVSETGGDPLYLTLPQETALMTETNSNMKKQEARFRRRQYTRERERRCEVNLEAP